MSRDDWEHGTIQLSTRAYAKFKAELAGAYNEQVRLEYDGLLKLHTEIAAQTKGKRGVNYAAACETAYTKLWDMLGLTLFDSYDAAKYLITRVTPESPRPKLKSPKKGEMPVAKRDTALYENSECSLTLDDANRTITWNVRENNHAVDHAHATWLGKKVFKLLNKVEWTRATGGVIYGNDEYNRGDRGDGGGNYITRAYGPIGKKAREW